MTGCAPRVAQVDPDGITPVLLEDRREPPVDLGERLVQRSLDELAVEAHERRTQAVRVLVQRGHAAALRADEALREHILGVAANAGYAAVLATLKLEPAGRLAKGASGVGHAADHRTVPVGTLPRDE